MFTATEAKFSGLLLSSLRTLTLAPHLDFLWSFGDISDFNEFLIYAKEYVDSQFCIPWWIPPGPADADLMFACSTNKPCSLDVILAFYSQSSSCLLLCLICYVNVACE